MGRLGAAATMAGETETGLANGWHPGKSNSRALAGPATGIGRLPDSHPSRRRHRCTRPRLASFCEAEPFDALVMPRNDSAVAVDSFCRRRLGGGRRVSERTGDSVKGVASLPPSKRPHGPRVLGPNHYTTVMFAAPVPVSPFSRLSQTRRTDCGVGVLLIGGCGSERWPWPVGPD
jgi:hypothetical protein